MLASKNLKQLFAGYALDRSDCYALAQGVLGVDRAWIMVHDTDDLTSEQYDLLKQAFERRVAGEPVAYILGEKEFMGLMFECTPDTLIPRPDTETLVDMGLWVIDAWRVQSPDLKLRVLDVGTGTGAIGIALEVHSRTYERVLDEQGQLCFDKNGVVLQLVPVIDVTLLDISQEALLVAQKNANKQGVPASFVQSDLLSALSMDQKFHLIVSNPPYIHAEDDHLRQGDLRYEPQHALTDGEDGLSLIERLILDARDYLEEGGSLWIEHGYDQALVVRELFAAAGYKDIHSMEDLSGIERITGGCFFSPF
ncbi:MAG: peptide chain release factor N(5)-glutamine methyltransferase [Alcaligenaceae bacterium]|nr:peptide chain release factor N(5)-glutamine methyltransferase [Alcaligenaceae bacterium]